MIAAEDWSVVDRGESRDGSRRLAAASSEVGGRICLSPCPDWLPRTESI